MRLNENSLSCLLNSQQEERYHQGWLIDLEPVNKKNYKHINGAAVKKKNK